MYFPVDVSLGGLGFCSKLKFEMVDQKFNLISKDKPSGDQPKAIELLVSGLENGYGDQTLMGVTGSGKTFTIANVIQEWQKPALVIAHNEYIGISY